MTQKTIKALYKQPVNYKLTKDGYKTINGVIQAQDGMPKVVDLPVPSELYTTDLQYNVNTEVNGAPIITTSQFTLPDDEICEAKTYCYAPKGTNYNYSEKQNVRHYDNFTKIGSPTISQNGILSDITTSNYLRLPNNFNSGNNSWEMLFKIKTSSDITTEQSWIGSSNKTNFTYPLWRLRDEYICLYLSSDGSNWDISSKAQTFQVSANTWYWVKLKFTGSSYESYYSTNGIDYILAYSVSSTSIIYQNQLWNIGCNNWSEREYLQWLGIIDLSESYIKINDEIWWVPYTYHEEEVTIQIPGILDSSVTTDDWQQNQEYKLYQLKNQNNTDSLQLTENSITDTTQKYKQYINQLTIPARDYKWYYFDQHNYTLIGDINYNKKTGIINNFSQDNYIHIQDILPEFNTFEMQIVFDYSRLPSTNATRLIGKNSQDIQCGLVLGIDSDNGLTLWTSSNGNEWTASTSSSYGVSINTKTYLKIIFENSTYTVLVSTDKINWTTYISLNDNKFIQSQPFDIGSYLNNYLLGNIYINECYIKLDGALWWDPFYLNEWLTNKSYYTYNVNTDYSDTLNFSESYIGVTQNQYHKYINPKVCLMPIDGGETKTVYSLNATEIGNTNFDIYTGISNRFSSTDYLQLPQAFNPGNNPWEMIFRVKTSSDFSDLKNNITGSNTQSNYQAISCGISKDHVFKLGISVNGSSWDPGYGYGTYYVLPETWYYIKIQFTGSHYQLYYSLDGNNYILDIDTISSLPVYQNNTPYLIGLNKWSTDSDSWYPWTGSIDLSESYIKINNEIWWRGSNSTVKEHQYITAKETVNGCLYNYNDDGSEHSFDVYYDSNYTQPILVSAGESYSEGTKVDTITLAQHNIWTYQAGGIWTKTIS